MQITVITPENDLRKEIDIINEMLKNGLERLHLRKPEYSSEELRKYIKAIPHEYHNKIIITHSYELFDEFDLGGIHLNGSSRRDEDLRKRIDHVPSEKISTSYHNWQKIVENDFPFGYVFISPVFDSISKKEYKANIDPDGAMKTKQKRASQGKYCPQIIGLGGVGINEIRPLHDYGFDGAALLGTLWMSGNAVATFTKALSVARSLEEQGA